jgi:UDP-GlcNAc:undecaprenyl-phosphate GlcNAc-1-phosphate transferase
MIGFILLHAIVLGVITAIAACIVRAMAHWKPLVDIPNERSTHVTPTPRGGGLGIVVAALIGWVGFFVFGFAKVALDPQITALMIGAVLVAVAGLLDDRRALPALVKFSSQAIAALIVIASGLVIPRLPLPIIGVVELGALAFPLTFLWLVGMTNVVNFMDGLDGLVGWNSFLAALAIALIAWFADIGEVTGMALALAAAILGFIPSNHPPARIFMGDVGSQFIGFTFAALGVLLGKLTVGGIGALIVPLLLLHFLFDTILTAIKRLLRGRRIWEAHREHIYQRLHRTGVSHAGVTLGYAVMAATQALFATWLTLIGGTTPYGAMIAPAYMQLALLWIVRRREHRAR